MEFPIQFDKPTIILASASKLRAKNLEDAGIPFIIKVSSVDDSKLNDLYPHEGVSKRQDAKYTKEMALAKLQPFIGNVKNAAVITADTTCYCCGTILEKAITKDKCREHHKMLSGNVNYVYTAVAIYYNGKVVSDVMKTRVKVDVIPDDVIEQICEENDTLWAAGYRSAGKIRPYLNIKNTEHQRNVEGISPKFVKKLLKKVGYGA